MNIIQNQGKRRDLCKSKGIREETDGRYKPSSILNPQRGKTSWSQRDNVSSGEGFTSDRDLYRWVSAMDDFYAQRACSLWELS